MTFAGGVNRRSLPRDGDICLLLNAFSVTGGFVLAWMGFGMLKGDSPGSDASAQNQPSDQRSLTPLILFAASPGTITGAILRWPLHIRERTYR